MTETPYVFLLTEEQKTDLYVFAWYYAKHGPKNETELRDSAERLCKVIKQLERDT